jgi:cytochrome c oxidase assembly protein subunit 15
MSDETSRLLYASSRRDRRYNSALHLLALITTCATFPLIFLGGLVTSHGAGMSVPDWPNSYGYNMFTFPPSRWVGGILYEHTHRLMGTVVGLCSIALTVVAWATETRRWVRWLATGVLGAVIFQGVLGGLRVVLVNLNLAVVHGCFAQAFFCLAALTSVVTSRWWIEQDENRSPKNAAGLVRIAAIALCLVYLQLIIGATMRHFGAGLAIPDVPLAYGRALPPTTEAGLKVVNDLRVYDLRLPRVTLFQVWIHFAHRIGVVIVTAAVLTAIVGTVRRCRTTATWANVAGLFAASLLGLVGLGAAHALGSTRGVWWGFPCFVTAVACGFVARGLARRLGDDRPLLTPAILMSALLVVQITLGLLTVILRKPADVASAHVAVGALLLVSTFVLTVRAARTAAPSIAAAARRISSMDDRAAAGRVATA